MYGVCFFQKQENITILSSESHHFTAVKNRSILHRRVMPIVMKNCVRRGLTNIRKHACKEYSIGKFHSVKTKIQLSNFAKFQNVCGSHEYIGCLIWYFLISDGCTSQFPL